MKAIIFGASGQDGHYLNHLCRLKGIEPVGVSRSGNWIRGDVSNYEQVEELVKDHQPVFIFHVAAISTTRHDVLFENHAAISTGTLNILEAVKRHCPTSRVFITGSGLQFKNSGRPISENDEFDANSAYSMARIHSVYAARYYRALGLRVYVGYLFHHESPFRKENHVSKMIALAVQRIGLGSSETIEVGDLSVEKEWTFAGDVARGIITLIEQDEVFEAAIGSGITYSIKDWLEQCFKVIGKDWQKYVGVREGFISEYRRLVSDPVTIHGLGWFPAVGLSELAKIMVTCTSRDGHCVQP
jgi:GDPmannose 4,6-dehydratase